jgi:hypothetical protein
MMLGVKIRDGTSADTSSGSYLTSRLARIKKEEDLFNQRR